MINGINSGLSVTNDFSTQQNKKTQKNTKLSRVEEIKQQIKNGTYKIDLQKSAEAMAKHLK